MNGKQLIDIDTGEIVDLEEVKKNKKRVTSFNKEVGVDTKFPYDCVTEDSLKITLDVMDAYHNNKAYVNHEYLTESIVGGFMDKSELSLLLHMTKHLSGWNIYIGTVQDLAKCGTDISNLAKLIKKSKNLRIVRRHKPFRDCIVIEVNPLVAWKGDTEYRELRLKTWYAPETYSETF